LPLEISNTGQFQAVTLSIQTPIKEDQLGGLRFFEPPLSKFSFWHAGKLTMTRFTSDAVCAFSAKGQQGKGRWLCLNMKQGDRRLVSFLYPPDSTPPQVLTETEPWNRLV